MSSTDGNQIIFISDRDGDFHLFIMNANGSGVARLTFNGAVGDDAEFKRPGH